MFRIYKSKEKAPLKREVGNLLGTEAIVHSSNHGPCFGKQAAIEFCLFHTDDTFAHATLNIVGSVYKTDREGPTAGILSDGAAFATSIDSFEILDFSEEDQYFKDKGNSGS